MPWRSGSSSIFICTGCKTEFLPVKLDGHKDVRANAWKDTMTLGSRFCEQLEGRRQLWDTPKQGVNRIELNEPYSRRAQHYKVTLREVDGDRILSFNHLLESTNEGIDKIVKYGSNFFEGWDLRWGKILMERLQERYWEGTKVSTGRASRIEDCRGDSSRIDLWPGVGGKFAVLIGQTASKLDWTRTRNIQGSYFLTRLTDDR